MKKKTRAATTRKPSTKKTLSKDQTLLTYGKYVESIKKIKLYEDQQTAFRARALDAIFYYILALSFVFSTQTPTKIQAHQMSITLCLSLLATLFIYAVVLQDLTVLERLKISFFGNCFNFEKKYKFFPPLFHEMIDEENFRHHGSPARKLTYYISLLIGPFIGMGVSVSFILDQLGAYNVLGWSLTAATFFSLLLTLFFRVGRFRVLLNAIITDKKIRQSIKKPTPNERIFLFTGLLLSAAFTVVAIYSTAHDTSIPMMYKIMISGVAALVFLNSYGKFNKLYRMKDLERVKAFNQSSTE